MRGAHRVASALLLAAAIAAGCTGTADDEVAEEGPDSGFDLGDAGDCTVVDMAVSSEKVQLLSELASTFNESPEARTDDGCVFVEPRNKASGAAATLLADGWQDEATEGPKPVVWSPASSAWGAIVNQRLDDAGQPPIAPPSEPFMLTPLVIAMPEPMASALGYPETPIGFSDIVRLAQDPAGWAAYGHPEWGPFRLGKTNPNFSTSGLSALIAQTYAATGTTRALSLEELARPDVVAFGEGVESGVVHYGDITMTFLNNWFRADQRGTALTYVSAVAVEEKSLIDYNLGNPDGVLDPGRSPPAAHPPRRRLPRGGHALLRQPLHRPRRAVGRRGRGGRRRGVRRLRPAPGEPAQGAGVRLPAGQPGGRHRRADRGRQRGRPGRAGATLEVPDPPVLVDLLDRWADPAEEGGSCSVLDDLGSRWGAWPTTDGGGHDEARPGQGGGRERARRLPTRTTRSGLRVLLHRTSGPPP
jgi:Ca-activated chloride channel family protein